MTSRERILKILNFKRPDRIGIHDTFLETTIEKWKAAGLPSGVEPEDYFGFDFDIYNIEEALLNDTPAGKNEKFTCLSFSEPFQRICDMAGREDTLRLLGQYPERLHAELIDETDQILNSLRVVLDKGIKFDGAWAWGDLAYSGGLFFSIPAYKKLLLGLHKKIFEFLNSQNLFVLFHSDGMIYDLIPYLLEAGVRAIHPLEESSGIDIYRLLKNYKNDMVFMGYMDIGRHIRDFKRLREKIDMLKSNSFYIYHADYPIMPAISFEDYALAIEAVKECGKY